MTAGAIDRAGQVLAGKYRLVSLIGQGGMGEVWCATHLRIGRNVAIKLLDRRYLSNTLVVQRFGREARAASAIAHPGIVDVIDLEQTDDGIPFLVMELLEGQTLAERIKERGKLDQAEIVAIFRDLLDALDAAHTRGIVHRDLKPDNIFLVKRGETDVVKILDFGISQKADEVVAHLTQTGAVLGTPHYMAPEQAAGKPDLDARLDVYATGVVMYECAVGDVPFDAGNYNALMQRILHEEPTSPRKRGARIDAPLEDVILLAMRKDRQTRPKNAGELRLRLLTAAGDGPTSGVRSVPPARAPSDPALKGASMQWGDAESLVAPRAPRPASPTPSTPRPAARPQAGGPTEGGRDLDELDGGPGAMLELDTSAVARSKPRISIPPQVIAEAEPLLPSAPPRSSRAPAARAAAAQPPTAPSTAGDAAPATDASRAWAIRAGIVVAVLLAIIVAVRFAVRPGVDPETLPDDETVSVAAPEVFVQVRVNDLPSGASVYVDDLPAAANPLRLPRGSRHTVTIRAPGYVSRQVEIVADHDTELAGDLRRATEPIR